MALEIPKYAILDGGMATELESMGHDINGSLWSSKLLVTDEDAVYKLHLSWLEAGADIIETNTYQASLRGFQKSLEVSEKEAAKIITDGAKLAVKARNVFWANASSETKAKRFKPLVAGSCGPYGASLCDCSEYNGHYVASMTKEDLISWHLPRIKSLVAAGVDLLAFDTIPASEEAYAIIGAMVNFPSIKYWISFSCKDGRAISNNDPVKDVFRNLVKCDQIMGLGFNCTAPCHINSLLKEIQPIKHEKVILVYANSGEEWTKEKQWVRKETFVPMHKYVKEWKENGAHWIGGCCRVTTKDIELIRHAFYDSIEKD